MTTTDCLSAGGKLTANWRSKASYPLADATILLAGYAIGDIAFKLFAAFTG